ncbi:hypothetical protein [Ramlibacter rhizophilus]|uniref:Uncharacterized protein n=1 Tax=Ramlibacter rhizophilus TaxID=1781167 RepID=A0A4Z0BRK8_9BURK|nr:hypothetical protein [Ramlibacter rhizophilus]TFZ01040.1 hypothetical protein EZ242_06495 [Ramlibacter rhizophilus]
MNAFLYWLRRFISMGVVLSVALVILLLMIEYLARPALELFALEVRSILAIGGVFFVLFFSVSGGLMMATVLISLEYYSSNAGNHIRKLVTCALLNLVVLALVFGVLVPLYRGYVGLVAIQPQFPATAGRLVSSGARIGSRNLEHWNGPVAGAVVGTAVGYSAGKGIESLVRVRTDPWWKPDWVTAGPLGLTRWNGQSSVPTAAGNAAASGVQEYLGARASGAIDGRQGK